MDIKLQGLERVADKLLDQADKFKKLQEFGNRQNYTAKLKKLNERLQTEHTFWSAKQTSPRLLDIIKDVNAVTSLLEKTTLTEQDKKKINQLTEKYPIT
jgi:thioredoxin-like negative regulator of GroEL